MSHSPYGLRHVTRWQVWGLPPRLLGAVLLVDLFAALLVVIDISEASAETLGQATLLGAATLTVAGLLHAEIAQRVERLRRRVFGGDGVHIDLSSVWTFAAALILPPAVASAVAVVLYLHMHIRIWRPARAPVYRQLFSVSTVILAIHAAAGCAAYVTGGSAGGLASPTGIAGVVTALIAYTVVNTCLIVGAVVMSADKSVKDVLGHGDEVLLELATLSLGSLVALAYTASGPGLVAFALPPVLVLHRSVLVRQLERAVNTDGKTGLLAAGAWHKRAQALLEKARLAGKSAAVLVLDLDHFKNVNDTHGHLAGDAALKAVADALSRSLRGNDLVGRFGGEEFVAMLPAEPASYDANELWRVAERIRLDVTDLSVEIPTPDGPLSMSGLTVSIGCAKYPEHGSTLEDLVAVADAALYAAKRAGRNTVKIGKRLPQPSVDEPASARNDSEPGGGPTA